MHKSIRTSVPLLALAAGLSAPALAGIYFNINGGKLLPLGAPQGSETFNRCLAGDLDGDRVQDVAFLIGQRLQVYLSPTLLETRMTGVANCRDFAVIRGGAQDRLLTVSESGLNYVDWIPGASYPNCWATSTPDTNAIWQSVTSLRTWSRGDELPHVFGLIDMPVVPDSQIAWLQPNAAGTAWLPTVILDSNSPDDIVDFQAFDWNEQAVSAGIGTPELALVSSAGLAVFNLPSMQLQAMHPISNFTSDATARIRMGKFVDSSSNEIYAAENVAWMSTLNGSTAQYLSTVGMGGQSNVMSLGTNNKYYAIACGDTGDSQGVLDGVDDLAISKRKTYAMTWLANSGTPQSGPAYGALTTKHSGAPGAATNSEADPLLADLDGDGDCDMAFILQDMGKLWIQRESSIDENELEPSIQPQATQLDDTFGIWLADQTGGPKASFQVVVTAAQQAYATHVQAMAWRSDGPYDPIDPNALLRDRKPHGGDGTEDVLVEFEFDIPSSNDGTFDDFVFMTIQLQEATSSNPNTPPNRAFPTHLVIFFGDGDPNSTVVGTNAAVLQKYIDDEEVGNLFDVFGPGNEDVPEGQKQGTGSDANCRPAAVNSPGV